MESDPRAAQSDDQLPDNREVESLGMSEFEESAERLLKNMEVLRSDVEQLSSHCSHQATELMNAAVDLRQQQGELKESYAGLKDSYAGLKERYTVLAREMQEILDAVDDLFSTKSTFEVKEKESEKLNGSSSDV